MMEPENDAPSTTGEVSGLEAYIRANRASFTEDALRRAAIAAGHPPEAVEAALAATRSPDSAVDRARVVRNLFIAYLATYLILDVLMLVNPANSRGGGFLGDVRGIGIVFLSVGLGAAFIASLVWIASRRVFVGLIGLGIVVSSLGSVASLLGGGVEGVLARVIVAIAGVGFGAAVMFAAARAGRSAAPATPSKELLLVVPILLLLAIGGSCIASGLPIPRPA